MKNKIFKLFILTLALMLVISNPSSAYELNVDYPMADKSQVVQFAKDRHASEEFLNSIDFVYEYSLELGIDPTIVMAISSLETGYGKSNLFRNYNNPGGIKSRNGWKKFDTIEDGYRYMIRLLATYSGKINKSSWLYGKATTTQELGNYYWVENGCDHGYHDNLTIVINKMLEYPIVKEEKEDISKEVIKEENKSIQINNQEEENLIQKILNRSKSKKSGMDLILNILNK